MGGINPYLQTQPAELPTRPFRVTYVVGGVAKEVRVDPSRLPYSRDGRKGSLLEIGLGNGVDIDHACGGVCACSTCHVIVRQGLSSCSATTDAEEDQLDRAPGLTPHSRLACQCVPDGSADLVVEVPNWNRNAAREEHH